MGEFTDKLMQGNGAKGKGVPVVGSVHYEMAGVGFYMNQTPKQVLTGVVQTVVNQLQRSGDFEQARKMAENPQPFYGQPAALAVFMACFEELEKRDKRIDKLTDAISGLADVLSCDESLKPQVDAVLAGLKES